MPLGRFAYGRGMPLPIALQLYGVRDELAKDLDSTCKAVRDIGYTHAEVGPFAGRTTEQVAHAATAAGLELVASHEGSLIGDDGRKVVQMARDLGMKYVVQPFLPPDKRNAESYKKVAETLQLLSNNDVTVCYHNHEWEFDTLDDGRSGWEVMFDGTNLNAEMDTCWVEVGGASAVEWLGRLEGRTPLVHIKDCRDYEKKTLCEIGTGRVPIPSIVEAAQRAGAKCLVVEQDNNWIDGDPIKSAKISYDNLRQIVG